MSTARSRTRVLLACDGVPGVGGLGLSAAFALKALQRTGDVDGVAPGQPTSAAARGSWREVSSPFPRWAGRYTPLRWMPGLCTEWLNRRIGSIAAGLDATGDRYAGCYAFTGVALELFERFAARRLPRILDSPNGHIRSFREVIDREARQLLRRADHGHPTPRMVARIEREYELATTIRVASQWAKRSLVAGGVPEEKVHVNDLEIDLERFRPPTSKSESVELRICYTGSVDLRKGIVYLLRAIQTLGRGVSLRIVGATGSRSMRNLFQRESRGLELLMCPGDPIPAFAWADLFVLPTLEDGFGYVVAEAMACGLPTLVTDACGAAEWVRPAETGWVVPARSSAALAGVLDKARSNKRTLREMGSSAREAVVRRMEARPVETYASWLSSQFAP